jgi:hypothetical protein
MAERHLPPADYPRAYVWQRPLGASILNRGRVRVAAILRPSLAIHPNVLVDVRSNGKLW